MRDARLQGGSLAEIDRMAQHVNAGPQRGAGGIVRRCIIDYHEPIHVQQCIVEDGNDRAAL